MVRIISNFQSDECGGTAIEYALIAFIVGLGIITSLEALPSALNDLWNEVVSNLS